MASDLDKIRKDKWQLNFNCDTKLPDPPGFDAKAPIDQCMSQAQASDDLSKKHKKAMEIAWSPLRQIFMTALMLWMSGSGLNIFTIIMTSMSVFQPLKALANVPAAFSSLEGQGIDLLFPKMVYCAIQFVMLAMAMYKLGTMGLLPISSVDWVSLLSIPKPLQYAVHGISTQ